MEISVYLKDYVEKLKKDKMKPFYNKKNNNFEIDNIYDYLKIIDILQNEKEKDRNAVLIVALPRKNLYDGLDEYRDLIYKAHDQSFLLSWLEKNPGNLYTYLGMVYVPNSLFFKTPSYITEREKRQSSVFMLFANSIVDVEKDTCISDEEAAYLILEGEEYYKKHYGSEKSIFKLHPTLKRLSKQQYQMNFTEVIISFLTDVGIILVGGLLFRDIDGMIYGMIVNILSAVVIDKMIYGMNSGKVAFIVTKNGKRICDVIDECSQRGSTILKAQGGYKQDDIQVVMCACNSKEMYQVRKSVKDADPDSFIVVVESHEVHGEGFKMTNIGEAEN